MPKLILNPTQTFDDSPLGIKSKKALLELIKQCSPFLNYGEQKVTINNRLYLIELTNPLLLRSRKGNMNEYRIEVLKENEFSNGGYSSVIKSRGVLIPENNYSFKEYTDKNKVRICKKIGIHEGSSLSHIMTEYYFTSLIKKLHCKLPMFDNFFGYFVMRCVGTAELRDVILFENYLLTNSQRSTITYNLLKEIAQIHSLGIVHNDLKPENIRINQQDLTITIIDYGFAHYIKDKTNGTEVGGTPSFMSPEALLGKTLTERSDAFQIGLVLAELWGDNSLDAFKGSGSLKKIYTFHLQRRWVNLFNEMNLDAKMQKRITKFLDQLTHVKHRSRNTITKAISEWEDIDRDFKNIPITKPSLIRRIRSSDSSLSVQKSSFFAPKPEKGKKHKDTLKKISSIAALEPDLNHEQERLCS